MHSSAKKEDPNAPREIKFKTKTDEDEVSWLGTVGDAIEIDPNEPVSMAKIYAKREELIQKYKYRIGLMCSTLLENPEQKVLIRVQILQCLRPRSRRPRSNRFE